MHQTVNVEAMYITEVPGLDPITVFWQNFEPNKGRVTIECWGATWSCYFGAMPAVSIQDFFFLADIDYLLNKLWDAQFQKKRTKNQEQYVTKIINAIKAELKAESVPA